MSTRKLIHIGFIPGARNGRLWCFLKREDSGLYQWIVQQGESEEEGFSHPFSTIEEALRGAYHQWGIKGFQMLKCGFRYTLPERDEHGINALFHQMVASYSTTHGVYFDEELGHLCFVQNASKEALDLAGLLQREGKI